MFSPCHFHVYVYVSIGALESDLLSQSTPCGTKWTLVNLLWLYSTSTECLKDTWSYTLFRVVIYLLYAQHIRIQETCYKSMKLTK